jgi:hypothetical protein
VFSGAISTNQTTQDNREGATTRKGVIAPSGLGVPMVTAAIALSSVLLPLHVPGDAHRVLSRYAGNDHQCRRNRHDHNEGTAGLFTKEDCFHW